MSPSSDPVWMLFRRRTFSRLAFWCQVLGFDLRDRSLSNRFYFVYFCGFWLAWCLVVFAMLGSALADSFAFFAAISPSALMVLLGAFVLAAWGLLKLWQVTGRSPFVFSEADAYLLCQTAVRRRSVGLAWFLMDWFGTAFFFAVGTIVISVALTDTALSEAASFLKLPTYFAAGMRSLAIVLPLQMGIQAGLYGLGALRLRRDRLPEQMIWLRLIALPLGLGLLAALFFPGWRLSVLAPLIVPLQAAFGAVVSPIAWALRAGLDVLILVLGMLGLWIWTDKMHLGQAARETRLTSVIRVARGVMDFDLIEIVRNRSKMAITHPPSQLPVKNGVWMLLWKELVQSRRSLRASQIMRWILVFLLSMGIFLSSSWTGQLLFGIFWAVLLGSLITDRLRGDLGRWWLLRSLPFRNIHILLALLAPAWVFGVLLGWLALVSTSPPPPFGWLAAALFPFLAACAALGSAHDILDHAKARVLMTPALAEENVPRQDIQGVLIILISVGIPLGLLTWGSGHTGGLLWGMLALLAAILITILLLRSVLFVYRWIK